MEYVCPCCGREVDELHFACKHGAKGGASGRGASKARSSEQARAAVMARWSKKRGEIRAAEIVEEKENEPLECEGRNEEPYG